MAEKKETKSLVEQFEGAFTLKRAEKLYPGKGREAMRAIAKAGGYGLFNDAELERVTLAAPRSKAQSDKIEENLSEVTK